MVVLDFTRSQSIISVFSTKESYLSRVCQTWTFNWASASGSSAMAPLCQLYNTIPCYSIHQGAISTLSSWPPAGCCRPTGMGAMGSSLPLFIQRKRLEQQSLYLQQALLSFTATKSTSCVSASHFLFLSISFGWYMSVKFSSFLHQLSRLICFSSLIILLLILQGCFDAFVLKYLVIWQKIFRY